MNVYYVNDTSRWDDVGIVHGGCVAVNASLKRRIEAAGHSIVATAKRPYGPIQSDIEKCDWLIVNGEGTFRDELIGHEPGRHERLFNGMRLAKEMGKRVYLTNAVWCNMTDRWRELLQSLDGISVREPASANAIYACSGKMPEIHPDEAYFSFTPRETTGERAGFAVGNLYPGNTKEHLTEKHRMFMGFQHLGLLENSWEDVVTALQHFRLYVTGQHHGVYAACRARCPFAAVRVNTHKLTSLFEWAGAKIPWGRVPMAECSGDVEDDIRWAVTGKALVEFEKLWDFLEKQTPWPIPTA